MGDKDKKNDGRTSFSGLPEHHSFFFANPPVEKNEHLIEVVRRREKLRKENETKDLDGKGAQK